MYLYVCVVILHTYKILITTFRIGITFIYIYNDYSLSGGVESINTSISNNISKSGKPMTKPKRKSKKILNFEFPSESCSSFFNFCLPSSSLFFKLSQALKLSSSHPFFFLISWASSLNLFLPCRSLNDIYNIILYVYGHVFYITYNKIYHMTMQPIRLLVCGCNIVCLLLKKIWD